MAGSPKQRATIDLLPSHWGRAEPADPEVCERLLRVAFDFAARGPLGHSFAATASDQFTDVCYVPRYDAGAGRVDSVDVQRVPQGLVPAVAGLLGELGYRAEVKDHREDSSRWVLDEDWRKKVRKPLHKVVTAVGATGACGWWAGTWT